jgi:CTP:molybdopterin cytidylyltransferase MocA
LWITSHDGFAIAERRCETIFNSDFALGMSTSLAVAARTAIERRFDGMLIILADMPLVPVALLQTVLATPTPAACLYPDGRMGAPAFFGKQHFLPLTKLSGDAGAGALLAKLDDVHAVDTDPLFLQDVDTISDFRRIETALASALR